MDELLELLNKGHQRAGLLAVLTGILQTSSCEATKKSIIGTLELVFSDYPVGDTVEKMTKLAMKEVVEDKKDTSEADVKAMFDQIMEMLKN
jgi:uncharacterized phage protein gp47/JayE